jgi:hypothetical protein
VLDSKQHARMDWVNMVTVRAQRRR